MQSQVPQLTDPYNVPRRPMDVEDYIDILRRHRSWIIGPLLAALVIGTVVAFLWPDTYISTAILRVTPAQVPERYVPSNINTEISQRINTMAQQILSRSTLTNIINVNQLYPRDRKRLPIEDVVEQMRKDIRIAPITGGAVAQGSPGQAKFPAFQVSYSYENRLQAQKITSDLVSRFIDENIKTRSSQSTMTTDFLREQWEELKRELEDIENKLTQFRVSNSGRLPEERMQTMQAITVLENRISGINQSISRVNQDKLLLESRMSILKDQLRIVNVPEPETRVENAKNDRLAQLERDILLAETRLAALKESYRDTHPDVKFLTANLGVLKRTRDDVQKQDDAKKETADAKPAASRPRSSSSPQSKELRAYESDLATVQSLIEARNLELENYQKEIAATERNLRSYQGKVESMPVGEQQYDELLRERALAKVKYEEMNLKMTQSQAASDIELRKQGETLDLLDPASLPITPSEPKRHQIIAIAGGLGLALGLFLAAAREVKDSSLKSLKDVRAYTQLMVLGSIPLLENDLVVRRRRRLAWLGWTTACLAGIAIVTGSILFYYARKV